MKDFFPKKDLLLVNSNPRIDGVVTLQHLVNAESVMYGWTLDEMKRREVWINVVVTGRDRLSKDSMVFQDRFQAEDVMVGYRYRDQLTIAGTNWTFDYNLMSEIDPTPVWYPKGASNLKSKGHSEDQTKTYVPLEVASADLWVSASSGNTF